MTDNKLIDNLDNENIPVFSVSEITTEITNLLEKKYNYIKIKGEISGETGNKYPEIYFSLKDNNNVISAIIKRNKISFLKFLPKDGLEVICAGKITAYTKRDSKFQIDVDSISVEGEGQLLKIKEELRKKLEKKGKTEKAIKRYERAIKFLVKSNKMKPNKADTLNYLGFATRKTGDFENGEKYYLQGLAIEPNHIGINEYLGELYVATNRMNLAKERLSVLEGCNCEEYNQLKGVIDGSKKSKY